MRKDGLEIQGVTMSLLKSMRKISATNSEVNLGGFSSVKHKDSVTTEDALAIFGYESFRPGQKEIIDEIMGGKDGVLAVMRTGYGKSALFQIPAIMTENLTVVVSPLISLMKDQVDNLLDNGVKAAFINSTQAASKRSEIESKVLAGEYDILYVSPERFNDGFIDLLRGMHVGLFAIDEAHCISSWGHDFRPSYARLGKVIEKLSPEQVLATTATATEKVKEDILNVLGIPNAKTYVRGIMRDNLEICIFDDTGMDRYKTILKSIQEVGKDVTGIVYVASKREADGLGGFLSKKGINATTYHAGLKDSLRKEIQEKWAKNGGVIVATSAFGMGIDRPDVRFVIHSGFTGSIEEWYQEIGRAGRDGKPSFALSLYNMNDDYKTQMYLIDLTNPSASEVKKFWKWIYNYAITVAVPRAKSTTINMTQREMGNLSRCKGVSGAISLLKRNGVIKTLGRGKYQFSLENSQIDFDEIESSRKEKLTRLYKIVSFYQSNVCRFHTICSYFGDDTMHKCNNCDNCEKNNEK